MKLFLFLLPAMMLATPCVPDLVLDSQGLPGSCFDATQLVALPFSTWSIAANDNTLGGSNDWDANDVVASAQFSGSGSVATFTLLAGLSAHLDYLKAGNTFLFFNTQPIGTTAAIATVPLSVVTLLVGDTATGAVFGSGPGNQSFVIRCVLNCEAPDQQTGHMPEPGTWALAGVGIAAMLLRRSRLCGV